MNCAASRRPLPAGRLDHFGEWIGHAVFTDLLNENGIVCGFYQGPVFFLAGAKGILRFFPVGYVFHKALKLRNDAIRSQHLAEVKITGYDATVLAAVLHLVNLPILMRQDFLDASPVPGRAPRLCCSC